VANNVRVTRLAVTCGGSSTCEDSADKFICHCADGWIGGGDDNVCTECQPGTYKSGNQCVNCDAGTYGTSAGANSITQCADCDAGKYVEATGSDAASDCVDCGAGKYVTGTGHQFATDCVDCGAGKYVEATGSVAEADCDSCEPGTFVLATGSTLASDCTDCAAGQFEEGYASTACTHCNVGDYSTEIGAQLASTCSDCLSVDRCWTSGPARDACDVEVDIDCVMTAYDTWGTCSTTCNEGTSTRQRTVISPACHAGFACQATEQTKICLSAPCKCAHVTCQYDTHDCYAHSAGEPYTIVNGEYHTNIGVTTQYAAGGNDADPYLGTQTSSGDAAPAAQTSVKDFHNQIKLCSQEQSVRVYHSRLEPLTPRDQVNAISTGHHCKTAGAVADSSLTCSCRCHSSFHNGYNPKVEDKFGYSCGASVADTDEEWRTTIAGTHDDC
jgi:hypothetical protein